MNILSAKILVFFSTKITFIKEISQRISKIKFFQYWGVLTSQLKESMLESSKKVIPMEKENTINIFGKT